MHAGVVECMQGLVNAREGEPFLADGLGASIDDLFHLHVLHLAKRLRPDAL